MSIDVRVPTTGNAGEDAVIIDWNVSVGAQVNAGDVLVVLETAKATVDVEAPESGEVLKIMYETGDEVPEHEVLAIIGRAGELPRKAGPAEDVGDPGATAPAEPSTAISASATPEANSAAVTAPTAASAEVPTITQGRTRISPRARILAERNAIALESVTGTGPGGRIIVNDILDAKRRTNAEPASTALPPTDAAPPSQPVVAPLDEAEVVVVPVRSARRITAQRIQASLQNTAQVTLTRYAGADALLGYVMRLRAVAENVPLPKIGVNDVVLFATARAVAKHPEANSWFNWDGIRQFRSVNLGFAVDTRNALLVPVIPHADRLTLAELAAAAKTAIDKSRGGSLTAQDMDGGTFTVSNLGGLGVHWFTPVLNPPQSCILGVGATHKSHPDGPTLLPLSFTFDHRAIDGAKAAAVLADITASIEAVDVLAAF
ncbi:MAG: dihydrolipoamide acetyltransferase family protein [Gemmatimonadaceae bacterium]